MLSGMAALTLLMASPQHMLQVPAAPQNCTPVAFGAKGEVARLRAVVASQEARVAKLEKLLLP